MGKTQKGLKDQGNQHFRPSALLTSELKSSLHVLMSIGNSPPSPHTHIGYSIYESHEMINIISGFDHTSLSTTSTFLIFNYYRILNSDPHKLKRLPRLPFPLSIFSHQQMELPPKTLFWLAWKKRSCYRVKIKHFWSFVKHRPFWVHFAYYAGPFANPFWEDLLKSIVRRLRLFFPDFGLISVPEIIIILVERNHFFRVESWLFYSLKSTNINTGFTEMRYTPHIVLCLV